MNRRTGFSLLEVLMAMTLTSVAAISMLTLYQSHLRAYQHGKAQIETQDKLRVALARISHELRSAGYDPSATSGAGVVVAQRDFLYLTRDLVPSTPSALDGADEHLAFCLYRDDTLGIHRGRQGGGSCSGTGRDATDCPGRGYHQPLAEKITRLEFRYFGRNEAGEEEVLPFDGANESLSEPGAIRRIEVVLGAEFSFRGQSRTVERRESVYVRNMGL
ncbi:PilW family protein [Geoalkalibacter subterraneus]|nr:prepilin-type N-terminal cleavage/methylation domain-containing protein [Geoalkalibacter subterraneus]